MGSIADMFSSASGTGGSSTDTITDQLATAIGDLVASALKSVLGNLS